MGGNSVIYNIGLWFVSYVVPFIYIYLCKTFYFNTLCTFQDLAQTVIHYEQINV